MKKIQKLMFLSLTSLMGITIASCESIIPNNDNSSSSTIADESSSSEVSSSEVSSSEVSSSEESSSVDNSDKNLATGVADYIYNSYKSNLKKTADFTLPTSYSTFNQFNDDATTILSIAWSFAANGEVVTDAIKFESADASKNVNNYSVIYNADQSTKESKYTFTGLITDEYSNTAEVTLNFYVPEFVYTTHAEFLEAEDASDVTIKAKVYAKYSSKKSLYVTDDSGYGYYVYTVSNFADIKIGDSIMVTGEKDVYYGVNQIANPTVKVLSTDNTSYVPSYVDATNVFANAVNNKSEDFVLYQNTPVKVDNLVMQEKGNTDSTNHYYYFNAKDSDVKYYVYWSTSYGLSQTQLDTLFAEWTAGYEFSLKGFVASYSGAYYIIPFTTDAITITKKVLTTAQKVENALKTSENLIEENYLYNDTVNLPATDEESGAKLTWAIKGESTALSISNNLLTVTKQAEATENVLTVKAELDGTTDEKEISVNVVGQTLPTITAEAALAAVKELDAASKETSTERYFVTAEVGEIYNTEYCNFYINVGSEKLTVYGLYDAKDYGTTRYGTKFTAAPIKEGDEVVLYTKLQNYNGTYELVSAWLYSYTPAPTAE